MASQKSLWHKVMAFKINGLMANFYREMAIQIAPAEDKAALPAVRVVLRNFLSTNGAIIPTEIAYSLSMPEILWLMKNRRIIDQHPGEEEFLVAEEGFDVIVAKNDVRIIRKRQGEGPLTEVILSPRDWDEIKFYAPMGEWISRERENFVKLMCKRSSAYERDFYANMIMARSIYWTVGLNKSLIEEKKPTIFKLFAAIAMIAGLSSSAIFQTCKRFEVILENLSTYSEKILRYDHLDMSRLIVSLTEF